LETIERDAAPRNQHRNLFIVEMVAAIQLGILVCIEQIADLDGAPCLSF
jgi:hypothetical protein